MTRFYDNITPLNAENLNGLVDRITESGIKAEDAINKVDLTMDIFSEFVNIFGNPITVQEFDNKLSAKGFDDKNLTATQFDVIGRTLII